jgi:hypothetical protein
VCVCVLVSEGVCVRVFFLSVSVSKCVCVCVCVKESVQVCIFGCVWMDGWMNCETCTMYECMHVRMYIIVNSARFFSLSLSLSPCQYGSLYVYMPLLTLHRWFALR